MKEGEDGMVKAYVKETVVVPDGVYNADIEGIEEKENQWYDPDKDEEYEVNRLCVTFMVTVGETTKNPTTAKLIKYMTPLITARSVLYGMMKAVLGREPEMQKMNVYAELGWLVGKKVKVVVKTMKDKEGQEWSRITDFLPYEEKKAREEESIDEKDIPF